MDCAIILPVTLKLKLFLFLLLLALGLSACQAGQSATKVAPALSAIPTTPGYYNMFLEYQGAARGYILVIPTSYKHGKAAPLILVFHGAGQDANTFATRRDDLRALADREGFLLVFPQATEINGKTRWWPLPAQAGVLSANDLGFTNRLLEDLQAALSVDTRRIYAAGFSSGGAFVHFLGAQTRNVFAGLAAVASSLGTSEPGSAALLLPPQPQQPIPILLINGLQDPYHPWEGGVNSAGAQVTSVREMVEFWVRNNGCQPDSAEQGLTNRAGALYRFSGCQNGAEVALVALTLMDHRWPDRSANFLFDANIALIEFFKQHTR